MKKFELKQIIKEEIEKNKENIISKLKEKLKKALEKLKKSGKVTQKDLLDFFEGFLENIDD